MDKERWKDVELDDQSELGLDSGVGLDVSVGVSKGVLLDEKRVREVREGRVSVDSVLVCVPGWDGSDSVLGSGVYGDWNVGCVDHSVGSWTLDKLVRRLMRGGHGSVSRGQVEERVMCVREVMSDVRLLDVSGAPRLTVKDAREDAVVRVSPMVATSSMKRSGSVMKVPVMLPLKKRHQRGMHYLVKGARVRAFSSGVPLVRALAQEILMVLTDQECYSVMKYRSTVKDAKANRMYLPGG
jgi:ribosomal protein S7